MIKNYYYLITGILAILFSISHAWNGQSTVLPTLHIDTVTTETRTIFRRINYLPSNSTTQILNGLIDLLNW